MSKSNLFSKLPNANLALGAVGVAAGVAVAANVAGIVIQKRAEKAEKKAAEAAAGAGAPDAAKAKGADTRDEHVNAPKAGGQPDLNGGKAAKAGKNPYAARQNAADGLFGTTTDLTPTNPRQAREQIVGWSDVALNHLVAYQAAQTNADGSSKLGEEAQKLLWQDIEYLGKMASQRRIVGQETSMPSLLGDLERVKAVSNKYASKLPPAQRLPDPVITGPQTVAAMARANVGPELMAEYSNYVMGSAGSADYRDFIGDAPGDGMRLELENAVSQGIRNIMELRATYEAKGQLTPETDAALTEQLKFFSNAFRASYTGTEGELSTAKTRAQQALKELEQALHELKNPKSGTDKEDLKALLKVLTKELGLEDEHSGDMTAQTTVGYDGKVSTKSKATT